MARHVGGVPGLKEAKALASWVGKKAPKKSSRIVTDEAFAKIVDEANELLAKKEIAKAEGKHFVAIYAECHYRTYGVPPLDLDSKSRLAAFSMANAMLRKQFSKDREAMARFLAWSWAREKKQAEWCRTKKFDRKRLDWRRQFGTYLLTDFRVAEEARKSEAR